MGTLVTNIAAGRVAELHDRVESNDPANSAIVLVPLEATGLVADSVMVDYDTLADLLAGATNEQTTMGRKILTDAELAAIPAPDDTNNRNERSLPTTTWTAATGNAIGAIAVCYDPDTTAGTDANIVPMVVMAFAVTPSGTNIEMTGGVYYRAKDATLGV